jgi:hypothetical protein
VGSLLEVRIAAEDGGSAWLSEHGFAPGANGWWSRSIDRESKLALVPAALGALGTGLLDLVVRDVDLVELRGEVRRDA